MDEIYLFLLEKIRVLIVNTFMREVPIIQKQSSDLLRKPMDRFLNDRDLRHERVNNT